MGVDMPSIDSPTEVSGLVLRLVTCKNSETLAMNLLAAKPFAKGSAMAERRV